MSASVAEVTTTTQCTIVWRRNPSTYEINTWVCSSDMTEKYGRPLDLSSVPSAECDAIAGFGFDAVWLMGLWKRSPAGKTISNHKADLQNDFQHVLPNYCTQDNVGSPYRVRRYVVDCYLGG